MNQETKPGVDDWEPHSLEDIFSCPDLKTFYHEPGCSRDLISGQLKCTRGVKERGNTGAHGYRRGRAIGAQIPVDDRTT